MDAEGWSPPCRDRSACSGWRIRQRLYSLCNARALRSPGVTPPCASALIESGVETVVVAVADPDPRVDGGGVKMLEEAGIKVIFGICGDEASRLNRGFFLS